MSCLDESSPCLFEMRFTVCLGRLKESSYFVLLFVGSIAIHSIMYYQMTAMSIWRTVLGVHARSGDAMAPKRLLGPSCTIVSPTMRIMMDENQTDFIDVRNQRRRRDGEDAERRRACGRRVSVVRWHVELTVHRDAMSDAADSFGHVRFAKQVLSVD